MHAALRVLALLNALALVLPPGWCCLPREARAQAAPPAPASCCHRPAEQAPQPAPPKEQPPCRTPAQKCCC